MRAKVIVFLLVIAVSACTNQSKECNTCDEELQKQVLEEKQASVMYEPSELASLMLEMYEENQNWKAEILKGNIPKNFPEKYKQMHTASSVNESAGGEFYNAMADTYLKSIEDLTQATPENAQQRYNNMVNVCVQCHMEICPGPVEKINKLFIE